MGLAAASFRHGPVEVVDENYRAVIFAGPAATRGINLELARELAKLWREDSSDWCGGGGCGRIVGDCGAWVSDAMLPLVEIIPVQIAAMRFAFVKGLEIGKFRHTGQVTRDEVAF